VARFVENAGYFFHAREHCAEPRRFSSCGRGEREEQAGADHLYVVLRTIAVRFEDIKPKEGGVDVVAEQRQICDILRGSYFYGSEADFSSKHQLALSGDGLGAGVVKLVVENVGVTVIAGLGGFDRLVLQSRQDEAIRLVKKGLVLSEVTVEIRGCGRVMKQG
jgi:hypothetical protein